MNADLIIERLERVRPIGDDRFVARCPAHADKTPSLSIRKVDDRLLLHCFVGCRPQQVVEALGLSMPDLFVGSSKPDPARARRRRAIQGLENWSSKYLTQVCALLRNSETLIDAMSDVLSRYESGKIPRDPENEERAWSALAAGIEMREKFERDFVILQDDDLQGKLNLWRAKNGR